MKVITMATPGKYMIEARDLADSGRAFGVNVYIVPIDDAGSWERNCNHKAKVMRDALQDSDSVLFLDADCRIAGSLDALHRHGGDIALGRASYLNKGSFAQRYRYQVSNYGHMWNSGVTLVRRNDRTLALMDAWVAMCERRPTEWDQMCLQWAHRESGSDVDVVQISPSFVPSRKGTNIRHFSAFHKYSKKANQRPHRRVVVVQDRGRWEAEKAKWLDRGYAVFSALDMPDVDVRITPEDALGKAHDDAINDGCTVELDAC